MTRDQAIYILMTLSDVIRTGQDISAKLLDLTHRDADDLELIAQALQTGRI